MVYTAFHRPGTPLYRWVSGFIWLMIVLSVVLFFVELSWASGTFGQSSTLIVVDN
ncbi:MAG: hypothetical protein ACI9MR_004046, partial [Myxococcota bacterium]